MAMSGLIEGSYHSNGNYKIELEWEITSQSVSNNTSSVRVRTYLVADWTLDYSATKYGETTVDGTTETFSTSTNRSGTGRWLVGTTNFTVGHNEDGSKTASISGEFDLNITVSGNWVGTLTASGSATLETIPRASEISDFSGTRIGETWSVSIDRKSSDFDHDLEMTVNGKTLYSTSGVNTSHSWTLSTSARHTLYDEIGITNTNITVKVTITTKDGNTTIGSPDESTRTAWKDVNSPISSSSSFTLNETLNISIDRTRDFMDHIITLEMDGDVIHESNKVDTSYSLSLSTSEREEIYNKLPESTSGSLTIRCVTYDNGVRIRHTSRTRSVTGYIPSDIRPSDNFYVELYEYNDNVENSSIESLVKGESELLVSVTDAEGGIGTKDELTYRVDIGEQIRRTEKTDSSATIHSGTIEESGELEVVVRVTDSRGRHSELTLYADIKDYEPPSVEDFDATRTDGAGNPDPLGENIKAEGEGKWYYLGGENSIEWKLEYRERGTTTWNDIRDWNTDGTDTGDPADYSIEETQDNIGIASSYEVVLKVKDYLNETEVSTTVATGQLPLSLGKEGVGIGKIHEQGALDVKGAIYADGTLNVVGDAEFEADILFSQFRPKIYTGREDTRLLFYTNSDATDSYSWLELWGDDGAIPERAGEITMGATAYSFRLGSSSEASGDESMRYDEDGLIVENKVEVDGGVIQSKDTGGKSIITGENGWNNTEGIAGVTGKAGSSIGEGHLAGYINGQRAGVIGIAGSDAVGGYFEGGLRIDGKVEVDGNLNILSTNGRGRIYTGTNALMLAENDLRFEAGNSNVSDGIGSSHLRIYSSGNATFFNDLSVGKDLIVEESAEIEGELKACNSSNQIGYYHGSGTSDDLRFSTRYSSTSTEAGWGWEVNYTRDGEDRPFFVVSTSGDIHIPDGDIYYTNPPVSSYSSNVRIGADTSRLFEVSSSKRYKQDITTIKNKEILKARGVYFRDKTEVEQKGDEAPFISGFIAEEFDELGLKELVNYKNGKAESIQYDRVPAHLLVIIQQHQKELEKINKELVKLKEKCYG